MAPWRHRDSATLECPGSVTNIIVIIIIIKILPLLLRHKGNTLVKWQLGTTEIAPLSTFRVCNNNIIIISIIIIITVNITVVSIVVVTVVHLS